MQAESRCTWRRFTKVTGESAQNARRKLPLLNSRGTCRMPIWVLRRSAQGVESLWRAPACQITSRMNMMVFVRSVPSALSSLGRNIWVSTSRKFTRAPGGSDPTAQNCLKGAIWIRKKCTYCSKDFAVNALRRHIKVVHKQGWAFCIAIYRECNILHHLEISPYSNIQKISWYFNDIFSVW